MKFSRATVRSFVRLLRKLQPPSCCSFITVVVGIILVTIIIFIVITGCTQIPISTLSHIWVFVRLYGIVYVIIVIIIIIIIII